jgi:MSHA biogenesis protein MshP
MSTNARRRRDPSRHAGRGFALVPAIFLIVVLAALAAFAVRLDVQQQQTVDLAVLGARALAAANVGVEWGAYRALHGTCAAASLPLSEGALAGFDVDVTCAATQFTDGASAVSAYVVDAVATAGRYGDPGYVRRSVRVTLTDAP